MKKLLHLISAVTIAALFAIRAHAGETYSAPPPSTDLYGTGWYGAIDLGANLHQNRGDVRVFTNGFGDSLTLDPTNDSGFFGGIKVGYVFGTGPVRPAVEGDFFYNGWETGADSMLVFNGVTTTSSSNLNINTGAFMSNFLLRFPMGRFQPYGGVGVGVYYAESASGNFGPFVVGGSESHADFAWQLIAGGDYYVNTRNSIFIEYKYLVYSGSQIDFGNDRSLSQHLLGGGWRFHF